MPRAEIELVQAEKSLMDKLEKSINKLFFEALFIPILKGFELPKEAVKNAPSKTPNLSAALRSGRVVFFRGEFTGRFSAAISRELKQLGAKYDRSSKSYRILKASLPPDLVAYIESSEDQFKRQMKSLDKKLQGLAGLKLQKRVNFESFFSDLIYKADDDMDSKISAITVSPKISAESKKKFIAEYVDNMEKSIQDFADSEVKKLRKEIAKRSKTGVRYEYFQEYIKKRYNVSQSKAKFLARQESNLAVAKFQEQKMREAGSEGYIWKTVKGTVNHPVRPEHKILDGKYFTWDKPPVTSKDGRRNHPKEDFNCRCRAKAVIKF